VIVGAEAGIPTNASVLRRRLLSTGRLPVDASSVPTVGLDDVREHCSAHPQSVHNGVPPEQWSNGRVVDDAGPPEF